MKIQAARVIITGGNRGIGLAFAEMVASQGAHVVIVSRSLDESLKKKLLAQGALSVSLLQADLSSREGVQNLCSQLEKMEIDILFNNAGLLTGGLIEEQSLDDIYTMFQVNLNAVVHLTRAVIPKMIQMGRGKIINNSSVSAFMHFPCASTYAASKAAVVAFTDCIELELAGTGVSTLCLVTPGIKTRMFDEIEVKYSKNFEIPQDSISPEEYAERIRGAIESDAKQLFPVGLTAFGLWTARYVNPLFQKVVRAKFKR